MTTPTPPYVCFVNIDRVIPAQDGQGSGPWPAVPILDLWVIDSNGDIANPGNPAEPYSVQPDLEWSDAFGDNFRVRADGLISSYLASLGITGLDDTTPLYWL